MVATVSSTEQESNVLLFGVWQAISCVILELRFEDPFSIISKKNAYFVLKRMTKRKKNAILCDAHA